MKRFIVKMMKGNKKEYLLMISILSLIVSFLYVFLSLYDVMSMIESINIGLDLINFITIALSVGAIIAVNNYFVEERTQEYALLLLTGRNMKQIVVYILMQFGLILFVSFVLGGTIGLGWIVLLNLIYCLLHIDFMINQPFIGFYVLMFFVCVVILLAYHIARFNKIEININNYLRNRVQMSSKVPVKGTTKYLIFTLLGLMLVSNSYQLTLNSEVTLSSIISFVGVIGGIMLLVTSIFPFIYYVFHKSLVLKGKTIMFILNGFMELVSTIQFSFMLNCGIIPILLISILMLELEVLKYIMLSCYVFILLMIMICFILQLNLYNKGLSHKIVTLKSLGYKKNNIRTIQFVQVIIFLLVAMLPLIAFSGLLMNGYVQGILSWQIVVLLIGSYIGVYLIIGVYMIIKFNSIIKGAY